MNQLGYFYFLPIVADTVIWTSLQNIHQFLIQSYIFPREIYLLRPSLLIVFISLAVTRATPSKSQF